MNDLISIIIPVYNTSKYLKQCLNSVINQSYNNLQIILVNDQSTDNSLEICYDYSNKDERIEVITKENEGLGLTRNAGLRLAKGKYVTFLDSDDWFEINHIENLYKLIKKYNVDLVIGTNTRCTDDGKPLYVTNLPLSGLMGIKKIKEQLIPSMMSADKESKKDLGIPMSVCFNLYTTDIINTYNLKFPSERYCISEDFFFNIDFLNRSSKVFISNEKGYFYRFNPISITRGFDEKQINRTFNFYTEIKEKLNEKEYGKDMKYRIKRGTLAKVRSLLMMISRSGIPLKNKRMLIKRILESNVVRECFDEFSLKYYRVNLRIIMYCIKKEMINSLLLILKANELIRKINL